MTTEVVIDKEYKEPEGKYVHFKLVINSECSIVSVVITGDFFAYPPENIDKLSLILKGGTLLDMRKLKEHVSNIVKETVMIGIDSNVFKELIFKLFEEGLKKCRSMKGK